MVKLWLYKKYIVKYLCIDNIFLQVTFELYGFGATQISLSVLNVFLC